jgi:nitrogen regulatory protein PII
MSGQPYRYAKDVASFRNDYMESLGLRANLDNENLQANKIYKETGSLPPKSTMKDMRTTAEILADTEKLKLTIVNELKDVCTPQMALSVVQKIQSSPLNGDGSLFVFLVQNISEIVAQLKKKYKVGIVGNDNDVETFVTFITKAYSMTKDIGQTVKSAFDRPINNLGSPISEGDLNALSRAYESIQYKLISNIPSGSGLFIILSKVRDQFDAMSQNLSTQELEAVKQYFFQQSNNLTPGNQYFLKTGGFEKINAYLDKLPAPSILKALMEQLSKSTQNQNRNLSLTIAQNLSSLLPTPESSHEISLIMNDILTAIASGLPGPAPQIYAPVNPPNVLAHRPAGTGLKRRGRPKGSGIVKPLKERIDHTQGIKQGATHVPFGKYILNKNKLDSDLVYFKHVKGYGVKGYPVTKVSNKLGSVLRTIIGGGVPKFEDLNGLSESEKEYLHKVATKVGIMDKLTIPTPSKDKQEQDIHQFEVMKGELLSGNDSPEMIKKFKLLLLRLSRNGTIPKRETTELMEDLIQLGY